MARVVDDILIMQTQSPLPLISVLVATRDRPEALTKCIRSVLAQNYPRLEVLVLDDASGKSMEGMLAGHFALAPIRWMRAAERLGVAGARNQLIQATAGEILLFLDDDATLKGPESLHAVSHYFVEMPDLGTLAFRIVLAGDAGLQVPFPRRSLKRNSSLIEARRLVSYYLGAGHAIRREAFERCGLYQSDLVYGDEELDHAYRQIEAGFSLAYAPEILVHHAPSILPGQVNGNGREKLYHLVRNRIWNGYKHLPIPYLLSYLGVWTVYFLAAGVRRGSVGSSLRGIYSGFKGLHRQHRKCLSPAALQYLRTNYGRLWY